jgi:hyperosmotically inducible protein
MRQEVHRRAGASNFSLVFTCIPHVVTHLLSSKTGDLTMHIRTVVLIVPMALGLLVPPGFGQQSERIQKRIEREARHELVMLPYYGVFDNLAFRVEGETLTLQGQVTRPTLKRDAERAVTNIEGVEHVVNNIEVLPLSSADDRTRLAVYRAIYGNSALNRYALQAVPPIHMIVKNGNVTLEGTVAQVGEKNIANLVANGVDGVFSVTDHLNVEK